LTICHILRLHNLFITVRALIIRLPVHGEIGSAYDFITSTIIIGNFIVILVYSLTIDWILIVCIEAPLNILMLVVTIKKLLWYLLLDKHVNDRQCILSSTLRNKVLKLIYNCTWWVLLQHHLLLWLNHLKWLGLLKGWFHLVINVCYLLLLLLLCKW
jgi:hypothetical protein